MLGRKTHEHGQKAAKATWGSRTERFAERNRLRELFEVERSKHRSDDATYAALSKQTGKTKRTIRRIVTGH